MEILLQVHVHYTAANQSWEEREHEKSKNDQKLDSQRRNESTFYVKATQNKE